MVNIIAGLLSLFIFFSPFVVAVILNMVDRDLYGFLDWFNEIVLARLGWTIIYVFSFCLFWSGISMLRMKSNSRKLAIISSIAMLSSALLFVLSTIISSKLHYYMEIDFQPWISILLSFLVYTILLIAYLNDPGIKQQFNEQNVRIPFKKLIFIILILFLFPLILRLPFWLFSLFAK